MQESTFDLERKLVREGYQLIVGLDEAGRGPLAGPVVAAAVAWRGSDFPADVMPSDFLKMLRDSKTLSEKQREKAFAFIQEYFWVGVGLSDHRTIDRVNVLEATFLAMKKAETELMRKTNASVQRSRKTVLLVDGNHPIPNFSGEQKAIVSGDKLVKTISAASIVAKVTRDRLMLEFHKLYPVYGFDQHKGYGTARHCQALNLYGPCPIHRLSFEPVNSLRKKKIGDKVGTV